MLKLGGGMLGQLLAADPGYRGPRTDCGQGHDAEFVAYRDKVIDTVLGPVCLTRAWYHCADCKHGFAPRDAELGVAGQSMSPGLAAMTDLAAADGPFARASRMLQTMAGVHLTAKRVERSAEASGTAAVAAVLDRAKAITARKLLAGRCRPVLLLPQGRPVRRAGHHGLLLRFQALARAAVPAGAAGAALGGV
jgi:hypothetical protein